MSSSTARDAGLAGTIVAGTYRIERQLGEGGMGVVWEAVHLRVPRRVAVKVLRSVPDPAQFARFRQEAEVTSRLRHPNIVDVLDFDTLPDGTPCMVMELLEGESLATRLRRGALPTDDTLAIVRQIASALAAAHDANVVHRDLKPDNVFLVASAGEVGEVVKVLDFGISKVHGASGVVTHENVVLGTPQYMAPEQAAGDNDQVDARADQFALAVMAFQMLAGTPPFTGTRTTELMFKIVYEPPPPLASLVPDVPANVAAALERAMAKRAQDRFADVSELVEALTGEPLLARPSSARMNVRTLAVAPVRRSEPVVGDAVTEAAPVLHGVTVATKDERRRTPVAPEAPAAPAAPAADAVRSRRWIAILVLAAAVIFAGGYGVARRNAGTRDTQNMAARDAAASVGGSGQDGSAGGAVRIGTADVADAPGLQQVAPDDASTTTTGPTPADAALPVADAAAAVTDAGLKPAAAKPAGEGADKLPAEITSALADGEAALRAGDATQADTIGKRILRSGPYREAYTLLTVAACLQKDLPAAKGWLRQVPGKLQGSVRARCARVGFPLE